MHNINIHLLSIDGRCFDGEINRHIRSAVQEEFVKTYTKEERPTVELHQSKSSSDADILLELDEYPKEYPNTIQLAKSMAENLSVKLKKILPEGCNFKGKILVRQAVSTTKYRQDSTNNVSSDSSKNKPSNDEIKEPDYATSFTAREPKYSYDRLVISDATRSEIDSAIAVLQHRDKLFNEWGLGSIMSPASLINFYGPSGTGKTMAGEAIAHRLKKKIILATYADIESKYHGEGPKRLKGLFKAAKEQDAVIFIDEADSMLSARLENVSQGSEQAINSMRSQLLMSLEDHDGIVIFATNLIKNYDKAFLTRLRCIEIPLPDAAARVEIWHNHLYPVGGTQLHIPLGTDIDLEKLAEFEISGRDIRNAVLNGCTNAVKNGREIVVQDDFIQGCYETQKQKEKLDAFMEKKNTFTLKNVSKEEKAKLLSNVAESFAKEEERDK